MKVHSIQPSELTADHIALWRSYQECDFALSSPFLSPEYAQAAAAARPNVRIGVVDSGDRMGFVPFQLDRWSVARPVGARACDLCGIVGPADLEWSPLQFVRESGFSGWAVNNAIAAGSALQPFFSSTAESPYIDLSAGFDAFQEERRAAGSSLPQDVVRRSRRIGREAGDLRFEFHTDDRQVFETLLTWKSEQRERTRTIDVLRWTWMVEFLERLRGIQTPEFAGVLSALYAGNDLVAVHFGIRSRNVWHYWFPAYNRAFHKYSPGLLLLFEMVRAATETGMHRIDLGHGGEPYKMRFKSGGIPIGSGSIDRSASRRVLTFLTHGARRWSQRVPIAASAARSAKKLVRRWQRI